MPPTAVHFNGSVNLPDTETVFRELVTQVPVGVSRLPDGETGDRQNWIFFQLHKFRQTPGIEEADVSDQFAEKRQPMPKVRLAEGADPSLIPWPDLGYATAYHESFQTFQRLRKEGSLPKGIRFQAQYPTPLASVSAWFVEEDQQRVEAPYQAALFADLDRLLSIVPHDQLAVQWDVAVEFSILEGGFVTAPWQSLDTIVQRLVECVHRVPRDVPVGMHLCYGDNEHQHFVEPESLWTQVRLANAVTEAAERRVNWFSFTVPQDKREPSFFEPLGELRAARESELYFALVPYYPARQEPGTTDTQVRLIDEHLGRAEWGICTECGMARAEQTDIPTLLEKHREILAAYAR